MGSDKLPRLFDLHYFLQVLFFWFILLLRIASSNLELRCFAWPRLALLYFIEIVVAKVFRTVLYLILIQWHLTSTIICISKRRSSLTSVCLLLNKLLSSHSPFYYLQLHYSAFMALRLFDHYHFLIIMNSIVLWLPF